jgi:hypothetical protein
MTTSARAALSPSKQRKKAVPRAKTVRAKSAVGQRAKQSATSVAIATEHPPAPPPPALDCLAAGAAPSETDGKIRVQLMFENGAVLPVEMSNAAGAALSKGLAEELPKK